MSTGRKRIFKILLAFCVSGLLCWLVLRKYPLAQLGESFSGIRWGWVLGAISFRALMAWSQGVRWKCLFPLYPFGLAVEAALVSEAANLLIPARAGEVVRAWFLKRMGAGNMVRNFTSAVVERLLDAATLFIFALVGLAALGLDFKSSLGNWPILIAFAGAAVFAAGYITLKTSLADRLKAWVRGRESHLLNLMAAWAGDALGQLRMIHIATLLWSLAASMAILLGAAGLLWCSLKAAGVGITYIQSLMIYPLVGLSLSVPVSVGYVGVFHGSLVVCLMLLGFDSRDVIGPVVVAHLIMFAPVLIFTSSFALLHLLFKQRL